MAQHAAPLVLHPFDAVVPVQPSGLGDSITEPTSRATSGGVRRRSGGPGTLVIIPRRNSSRERLAHGVCNPKGYVECFTWC